MAALLTARPISGDWKLRAHTRGGLKRLKASRRGALDASRDSACAGVRVCGRASAAVRGPCCESRWLHGLVGWRGCSATVQRALLQIHHVQRAVEHQLIREGRCERVAAYGCLVWRVRACFVGRS
jgi:hypothetical protein